MRLIDADKLHYKRVLLNDGTQSAVVVFAKEIDKAKKIEAIPIEFIEEYIKYQDTEEQEVLRMMWHAWELWEKENGRSE